MSGLRGLSASFVLACDGGAPIANGALVLDAGGRIVAVGEASALRAGHPEVVFTHHDAVLTPGLVNAHVHLELSALAGRVGGGRGFAAWAEAMLQARDRTQPELDFEAIDAAVGSLLAAGTVAVGEVSNSLAAIDALGTAPLLGRVFHEVFGLSREAAEAARRAAVERRERVRDWPRNLSYAPAPHTVYTLHPETVRALIDDARALGQRSSLHLCEHAAERAFLRDGGGPFARFLTGRGADPAAFAAPGTDAVHYADSLGALAADVIAVHLTDARPEELATVAARGAPVVLCPRSNLHIEVKLPPLTAILEAGIAPALGTDSLASCPSLDVLADARSLAQRFPTVSADTLLGMATAHGADVLGLSHLVGRLREGLAPGVLAFGHPAGTLPDDPARFVLQAPDAARELLSRPATQISEAP